MTLTNLPPSWLNTVKPRKKIYSTTLVYYLPLTCSDIRGKSLVNNLVSALDMSHCAGSKAQLVSFRGSSLRFLSAVQQKRALSRSQADFATLWTQGIRRKYKGGRSPSQKWKKIEMNGRNNLNETRTCCRKEIASKRDGIQKLMVRKI